MIKGRLVAEEQGLIGRHGVNGRLDDPLGRGRTHRRQQGIDGVIAAGTGDRCQTAVDQIGLAIVENDAGSGPQEVHEVFEIVTAHAAPLRVQSCNCEATADSG
jgi:hypothetical protein